MNYSEKWGKDVDEAVRLALIDLGLTEDEVVVTVIEEPTKGFFGVGAKLAKVRVEKISEDNSIDPSIPIEKESLKQETEDIKAKNLHRDYRKKNKNKQADRGDIRKEFSSKADGYRRDKESKKSRPPAKKSNRPKISVRPTDLVSDANTEAAIFLKKIIDDMDLDVTIEPYKNDEIFYFDISGSDSSTVIGKRGQTLDAIQYLTNLVVNKDKEDYTRVIIDVEGYRSKREKTLENLAERLAAKALKSGRSVKLEPMNPYERKVIHATLQAYEGITTRSEGEEPYRRVIIEKK